MIKMFWVWFQQLGLPNILLKHGDGGYTAVRCYNLNGRRFAKRCETILVLHDDQTVSGCAYIKFWEHL
jgi:hypothetical protein